MGRISKRYVDKRSPATFKLNITSMVDMFVMLLVFLLKSFDTSPVQINPNEGLRLPASTSTKEPVEALKLVVSKKGIFVEDRKIVEFDQAAAIDPKDLDKNDQNFIRTLYTELDKEAEKSKDIAKLRCKVLLRRLLRSLYQYYRPNKELCRYISDVPSFI